MRIKLWMVMILSGLVMFTSSCAMLTLNLKPSSKVITSYSFADPVAAGVITETDQTIAVTVPFGTDVTALVPTITIVGSSLSPASGVANDFSNPVTYTVTAADASTKAYTVTVKTGDELGPTIEFARTQYGNDYAVCPAAPQGGTLISVWTKIRPPVIATNGSWVAHPYPSLSTFYNTNDYILRGSNWCILLLTGNSNYNATTGVKWYNANSMFFATAPGQPADTYTYAADYSNYGQNPGPTVSEADMRGWIWAAWQVIVDQSAQTLTIRQWLKFGATGPVIAAGADTISFAALRSTLASMAPTVWTTAIANAWIPSDVSTIQVGVDNGYLTFGRSEQRNTQPSLAELQTIAMQTASDAAAWSFWPLSWSADGANLSDTSGHGHDLTVADGGTLYQGPVGPF
jgi:hypothetical protein